MGFDESFGLTLKKERGRWAKIMRCVKQEVSSRCCEVYSFLELVSVQVLVSTERKDAASCDTYFKYNINIYI